MFLSPLRGLDKICDLIPTADAMGYCYIAPPGLASNLASANADIELTLISHTPLRSN
jgi:hypothetical protein